MEKTKFTFEIVGQNMQPHCGVVALVDYIHSRYHLALTLSIDKMNEGKIQTRLNLNPKRKDGDNRASHLNLSAKSSHWQPH